MYPSMNAIKTKYLGPTNTRGARIKASCDAGSVTCPWEDAEDARRNHYLAVRDLYCMLGRAEKEESDFAHGWIGNECFWVEVK
jgi:hypothetical protein